MKSWEFTKVKGGKIAISKWVSETMGLMKGGYVYSTLFKYPESGPKRYELILSMYPQENFRTLSHITVYMEDIPGSTVQAAKFLADQKINILNSVSLTGISDTTIIWNIMGELSFAGEGDLIKERFANLKTKNDPSVSAISYISIKPANIGRIFRKGDDDGHFKEELKHGAPVTLEGEELDLNVEYGEILTDVEDQEVMITVDPGSWLVSVVFFKTDTKLIGGELRIPDCPGSIDKALTLIAKKKINLISVFTKVMISYQTMSMEIVADMKDSDTTLDQLKKEFPEYLNEQNGIFELVKLEPLN